MFSIFNLIPCILINLFWVVILYYTFINSRFDKGILQNITFSDTNDDDDEIRLDPINLSNIEDSDSGRVILFFIFTLISCIFGTPAFYFLTKSCRQAVDKKDKVFNLCAYVFILLSSIILLLLNFDIFSIFLILLFELSFLGLILYFKTDFLEPCFIFTKKLIYIFFNFLKCCFCCKSNSRVYDYNV
jgi:hypothetical protein